MSKEAKFKITQEQGHYLFQAAVAFILPAKLGDSDHQAVDRSLASEDVGKLLRELKSRSPKYQSDPERKRILFGPGDNWKRQDGPTGEGWKMLDLSREVEIKLSEDAHVGAKWCLLLALHPDSKNCEQTGYQEEVIWPMAERLRLTRTLRKALGLDKAEHKRLELDPLPGEEKEEKEEKEEEKPESEEASQELEEVKTV